MSNISRNDAAGAKCAELQWSQFAAPDSVGRFYALAKELSRPVARSMLPRNHAEAALAAAIFRAARKHELQHDPVDVFEISLHLLTLHIQAQQVSA
jgi:hypothetical protein